MYRRHIYNEIVQILHVIVFERVHFNILNSSNFLSDLEEMKSGIYLEETANAGMGLVVLASSAGSFPWVYCTFHVQETAKNNLWREFAIIIQCSP